MPVAKHLRHFYRGPKWQAARAECLTRAGGRFTETGKYLGGARCQQCGRLDRRRVWVISAQAPPLRETGPLALDQLWCLVKGSAQRWYSSVLQRVTPIKLRGREWEHARYVRTQIGAAHVNGVAGDDRPENLRALCRWCHLWHDRQQHHISRASRKDAARPIQWEGTIAV